MASADVALVVGLGVSGRAIARALVHRGSRVVAVDDAPSPEVRSTAAELGVALVESPDPDALASLVAEATVVVPSPGVPARHPVFAAAAAAGVPVRGEVELAATWASAPIVAITGTNGKTTVTTLVADMLEASGRRAIAAGNIGTPLADAVEEPADVFVVEVSSFQLALTETFHPRVGAWLNVAPDHLDWHPDVDAYVAAKARVWSNLTDGDVAVANAEDALVMRAAARAPVRPTTFGLRQGDFHVRDDALVEPNGEVIAPVAELPRALPHDLANALAAAAIAMGAGAMLDGVRATLRRGASLPHRVALVGEAGGVRWYDDSKATNPHAALAAVRGFPSVVLVAGGRNKGLDLGALAAAADNVRAVVAIGEAAAEVAGAFSHLRPVTVATSMDDAVRAAADVAEPGDAVLLSPGCASFDWYRSYAERGDDFTRAVRALLDDAAEPPRAR